MKIYLEVMKNVDLFEVKLLISKEVLIHTRHQNDKKTAAPPKSPPGWTFLTQN